MGELIPLRAPIDEGATRSRTRPPDELLGVAGALKGPTFLPAPQLLEWMISTFVVEGAPIENPDHSHLIAASIGVLWTNVGNARNGRQIVGQAEFKPPGGTMGKWARARAQAQILGWFGSMPDFLLTFDAEYAANCSDIEFCALVEHEMYHCGQAKDEFGAPRFTQDGMPVFCLRPHDVEEFNGVVRRYGADAAHIRTMIEAALAAPEVSSESIRVSCGTCMR
jgi:hypothetical protein